MQQTENALISALSALFLLSGACALVYQVAWQRILFAAFGADLESITIIVSGTYGVRSINVAFFSCTHHPPPRTILPAVVKCTMRSGLKVRALPVVIVDTAE
jgi:hypothetical protein